MDVSIAMAAVEDMHGVKLSIEIVRAGALGESGVELIAVARKRTLADGEVSRSVSRRVPFPGEYARDLVSALFRLVYQMDRDCSEFWQQEKLSGC
jgi:hypothetical protein